MGKLEIVSGKHSKHSIGLHIIWCTKFRHKVLVDGVDILAKRIIAQTCGEYEWKCHELEVMPDHVHLFVQINPTDIPANVAKTLKSISAVAIFMAYPELKKQKFWGTGLWSRGTYYGSVGSVSQEAIIKYIEEQKQN